MGLIKWVAGGLLVIVGVPTLVFVLPLVGTAVGSTGFLVEALVLVVIILVGLYLCFLDYPRAMTTPHRGMG